MKFTLIKELQIEAQTYFNEARRMKKLSERVHFYLIAPQAALCNITLIYCLWFSKGGMRKSASEAGSARSMGGYGNYDVEALREEVQALRRESVYLRRYAFYCYFRC
jgi:hypothetical protein